MNLLIDTHVIAWALGGRRRLSPRGLDALTAIGNALFVSAVTAWAFSDLRRRGRLSAEMALGAAVDALALQLLPLPADLWRLAGTLPNLHGDPVDRMLIAHAIHADLTLVTADVTIRSYPVRTLW